MLGIFSRTLCNCQIQEVTIRYCVTAEGNAIYFRDDSAESVLLVCCRRWSWNWMNSGRRNEKVRRSEKYPRLYRNPYKTGRFPRSIRLSQATSEMNWDVKICGKKNWYTDGWISNYGWEKKHAVLWPKRNNGPCYLKNYQKCTNLLIDLLVAETYVGAEFCRNSDIK